MFHKISENVYYTDNEEATDRPAMGYIKGDKYSLMVESGNSKANVNLFFSHLKENGLKEPDFVTISHSHWDHSYGLSYPLPATKPTLFSEKWLNGNGRKICSPNMLQRTKFLYSVNHT